MALASLRGHAAVRSTQPLEGRCGLGLARSKGEVARAALPAWATAVESAALEAARSSNRGSGWAPSGPASSWECRAAQRGRAGALPRGRFDRAALPHDLSEGDGGAGGHVKRLDEAGHGDVHELMAAQHRRIAEAARLVAHLVRGWSWG